MGNRNRQVSVCFTFVCVNSIIDPGLLGLYYLSRDRQRGKFNKSVLMVSFVSPLPKFVTMGVLGPQHPRFLKCTVLFR